MLFSELANEHWIPHLRQEGRVRESTIINNEQVLRNHLLPAIGTKLINKISDSDLSAIYSAKRAQGLHWRTVKRVHEVARMAFRYAVEKGYTDYIPANFSWPTSNIFASTMQTWSPEQIRHFLFEVPEVQADPLYPAFVLVCSTGMRKGELLGLYWSDIDFNLGTVTIQRQAVNSRNREGVKLQPTKTGKSRTITLDPFTIEVLRRHKVTATTELVFRNPNADILYGAAKRKSEFVIPDSLTKRFHRLTRVARLPQIRFHDLRHSYITAGLKAGTHPKLMASRAGHDKVSTTMDLYTHVTTGMDREAAHQIADLLFVEEDEIERRERELRAELAALAAKRRSGTAADWSQAWTRTEKQGQSIPLARQDRD
jgi:integrase